MTKRQTSHSAYDTSGRRVETAVTESSDGPAVTNSVTAYDFLGREVCVATPLGVTSNFYDGASSRVLRVTRTGSPDTLYAYDALGNLTQTALDADGDGATELAGDNRVSASSSTYEEDAAGWWRVAASAVWPESGSAACLTASVTRASACTDAGAASVWTVTETPGSVQPAVQKTVAGHAVSMVSSSVVTNTYAYDGFGRRVSSTDGRGSATVTAYNELGQVAFTEDAASNRTAYAYDASGRQNAVTPPLSNTVFTAYDSLGNVTSQWGGTYPVEYGYDTRNRKISMKTFRVENGNGDETLWLYDNLTGLLTNKVYADGSRVVYAYAADGRLASRTWARGVTAVYAYDAFGQVTNTAYSDDTPQVSYAYDRLGRVLSAVTGRSPSQFLIEEILPYLPPLATNIFSYSGLDLASETQNGVTVARRRDALGRDTGYGIGDGVSAAYGYDAFGRFASVTSAFHAVTNVFTYGYLQGTDLINCMTNSAGIMRQRAHEQNRGLVTAVSNRVNQTLISAFDYESDALGRRARRVDRTAALLATNDFAYNARGEITGAGMGGDSYGYGYDSIGNRVWSAENAATNLYAANALNQYTNVTGGAAVSPAYDPDGNLTGCTLPDGVWRFFWDAENRLAAAERLTFDAADFRIRVRNVYDHRSRRVAKQLQRRYYREDGGMLLDEIRWGFPAASARRVWDGWNIVAETAADAVAGTTNAACYTWGLDLSGTMQGAGGVGGLLAETKVSSTSTNTFFACCDANGNVTEYVDGTGTVRGRYGYSPFGEIASQSGDMADAFTHRFSTKPFDAETGLAMYQLRPYSPPLGRWLTRDPIEELGGLNLHAISGNDLVNRIDKFGMITVKSPTGRCGCYSVNTIKALFESAASNPIIEKLREPLRSAIKTHFNSMTFECRTNKQYPECVNCFGLSRRGVFTNITTSIP